MKEQKRAKNIISTPLFFVIGLTCFLIPVHLKVDGCVRAGSAV